MVLVPIIHTDRTAYGARASNFGAGDVHVSPLNISWMLSPGLFVQPGIGFNLPTAPYSTASGAVNLGMNTYASEFSVGVSYLKDGWNLSTRLSYAVYGENSATSYRSGNEFIMNWTMMKDVGGFSIGPVGYWRKQVTDDQNDGTFYRGAINGRAEVLGLGLGFSNRFGPVGVDINFTHDFMVRNTAGGNWLRVALTVPLAK